jgi:hypothetical protein
MKIQDVKKECLATIGLSVEFSNTEVSSLSRLLTTVDNAVEHGIEAAKSTAAENGKPYGDNEKIEVLIDLKSLKRIQWLLTQLTRNETSGLFEQVDADYRTDLLHINNIPANKQ